MQDRKKKSSIATKMILFILFVTVFVASIASSFIISQDYQKEMKRVEDSMNDITTSLMPTLAQSLYSEDEEQIKHVLKGILNVQGIVEVRVRLEDEEEDAHGMVNKDLTKMDVKERRSLGPSKLIKIIYKEEDAEEDEQEIVGDLYLYSTLQLAKDKIKSQVTKFGIVQLSQVLVLAISIFLIFRFLIAKHIKAMATYAEGIDLEDLSGPDLVLDRRKENSNDELQDLTDSFNDMKGNLKSAHAKLKDYAENLESIVDERTMELNQEKNNVTKLLHNMSQAVFKVNEEQEIVGPVSDFTKEVFGQDVLGKNIMDIIYSNIDKKSILYSEINSVFNVSFGEDEIQWYAVGHTLPEVLSLIVNNEKRIIHSVHDPIYNDDDELEFILYVVEDITEKVRKEEELSKKDEQLKIMKEAIDFGTRKELSKVMNQNFGLIVECLNVLRENWKLKNREEYLPHLNHIFRNLHTIKGGSRTLKTIRDIVHNVEDDVAGVIKETNSYDKKFILKLEKDLHKIHGTLFRYVRVINEQLRMGLNVDSEILKGMDERYESLSKFDDSENWLGYISFLEDEFSNFSKLCLAVNENEVFGKIDSILEKIKENKVAGVLEKPDVKVSITNSTLEIKKELDEILKNIKNYSEKLSQTIEEGVPTENINWVKKQIWELKEKGELDKDKFEKIFERVNNESLLGLMKSFQDNIHEMSEDLGKKVSLSVSGEDELIDTKKAQELKGVLTHIVRNSVDHGIEAPDERKKRGKEESGTLIITCSKGKESEQSFLKIDIEDDGNGIDSAKLFEKALEAGAIKDQEMNEDDKLNLIFLPSLSTKDDVTDISGRGVGMDAVKDQIIKMGGEIKVSSTISKGTKFQITIPEK